MRSARSSALIILALSMFFAAACGEPELNDEAKNTQGSSDPTGETGSPLPGLPPDLTGGAPVP